MAKKCPKCKELIDDNLEICPVCDTDIKKYRKSRRAKTNLALISIIICIVAGIFVSINSVSFKSCKNKVASDDFFTSLNNELTSKNMVQGVPFVASYKNVEYYKYKSSGKMEYLNSKTDISYANDAIDYEYKDFFMNESIGRSKQLGQYQYDENENKYYFIDLNSNTYHCSEYERVSYKIYSNLDNLLKIKTYYNDVRLTYYIDKNLYTVKYSSEEETKKIQLIINDNSITIAQRIKFKNNYDASGFVNYKCTIVFDDIQVTRLGLDLFIPGYIE